MRADDILAASIAIGALIFLLWVVTSLGLYLYRTRPRKNIYRKPIADPRSSIELFHRIHNKD